MGLQERKIREFHRREEDILRASLQLLNSDDWQTITVDRIAEVAEIGKGTVYKHFASKEDIYARLTLEFYSRLLEEFMKVNQAQKASEILAEFVGIGLRFHANQPEFSRVTQYCKRGDFRMRASDEIKQAFQDLDEQIKALAGKVLHKGIEEDEFAQITFEQMFFGINACFEGAVNFIWNGNICGEEIEIERYIDFISKFVLAGIKGLKDEV